MRILDVGVDDGICFVVEESLGKAASIAALAARGGLPPEESRRVTGEAATALEKARARGLHHLRLAPDEVWRMEDGSIKVRSLATAAALFDAEVTPESAASRADTVALVKLSYAALTGTWSELPSAGVPVSAESLGLAVAPHRDGSVVPPSEIAAGVPADLDLFARLTLMENAGPSTPGDLALQIAPWSAAQVLGRGAAVVSTQTGVDPVDSSDGSLFRDTTTADTTAVQPAIPVAGVAAGATGAAEVAARGNPGDAPWITADPSLTDRTEAPSQPAAAPRSYARRVADRAAAQSRPEPVYERFDIDEALHSDNDVEDAVPLLVPTVERPDDRASKIALGMVAALFVLAAFWGITNVVKIGKNTEEPYTQPTTVTKTLTGTTQPTGTTGATTAPTVPTTAGPLTVVKADAFKIGGGPAQASSKVKNILDNNPSTGWQSRWLSVPSYPAGQEVGISLDLGTAKQIATVQLNLPAAQSVRVLVSNTPAPTGGKLVGQVSNKSGLQTVTVAASTAPARYVFLVFTQMAPAEAANHYRAQLTDVKVTGS